MAISAPVTTTQWNNYVASPRVMQNPIDWDGRFVPLIGTFTFTAAGFTTAALGDIALLRLPPGKIRVINALSRIICPVGTGTADLDIGWEAYTDSDGVTAVAADLDGLAASVDVGGAAIDQALILPLAGFKDFDSLEGVNIACSFDTANSPATGVFTLVLGCVVPK